MGVSDRVASFDARWTGLLRVRPAFGELVGEHERPRCTSSIALQIQVSVTAQPLGPRLGRDASAFPPASDRRSAVATLSIC